MSSSLGQLFRISSFGESHGLAIGVIVDGCPAKLPLTIDELQVELNRRRPGQSILTTARQEKDRVEILSGVQDGLTLGTPIAMIVRNDDARPSSYQNLKSVYRPSHADYTYQAKYGIRPSTGGGRASARETIARVAGGAVASKLLAATYGIRITAWVDSVHHVRCPDLDTASITRDLVDAHAVRCPHSSTAARMHAVIDAARRNLDSVGGVIRCAIFGVPPGWGEPVFHKLEAQLAQAMLSLPATKGFEFGSGFAGTLLYGSEHNDAFTTKEGRITTFTNHSGGIQGGISNGEPIIFRVAFKPTATIGKPQATIDEDGQSVLLQARGRHDPCVLPRAVPIVEAMAALILADALLLHRARANLNLS